MHISGIDLKVPILSGVSVDPVRDHVHFLLSGVKVTGEFNVHLEHLKKSLKVRREVAKVALEVRMLLGASP